MELWESGMGMEADTRIDRYIQKFYQMRTQLQAISLRIQVRFSTTPFLRRSHPADNELIRPSAATSR